MRIFARTLLLIAFIALPTFSVTSDGWAMSGQEQQDVAVYDSDTATSDENLYGDAQEVSDPLSGWNRLMFQINDMLYFAIIKPISQIYAALTPQVVRVAIRNFFHNLQMPQHFVGALLQGDFRGAGRELGRFGINTVLGLGFFDVAGSGFNLHSGDEDIGQVLGKWGAGDDLYLVWPILGPSNLRDTIGLVGDTALSPLSYYPKDKWTRVGIHSFRTVNNTSLRIGEYEDLKAAALDPYISLRDAYLKMRRKKIAE